MLTLEKNNESLNTSPDFSVQIEDQSPFTKFDEIQGSKAIGISLPANDINRQALNNPERFEKMGAQNDRKFDGYMLRHNGQPLMPGTLIIEDTTHEGYSGWLRDLVGDLSERVKGKYINQTELGGEKTFDNKSEYDPDTDDYCCPKIFNRHFWRDRGKLTKTNKEITDSEGNKYFQDEDIGNLSLQYLQNEQYFVNFPGETGVVTGGIDKAPVVSPFLFLWKAVEMILWDNKIQVTDNFLKTNADLKKLFLYHTWNIAKQEVTTTSEIIYHNEFGDYVIPWEELQVVTTADWSTSKLFYKDLLPKMPLGEFLIGIGNKFNLFFDFNGIDEVRILDREAVLISDAYDLDQYAIGEWQNGTRKDVCINLKSEIDSADAAFSDNYQDLSDMRDLIKTPAVVSRPDLNALTPDLDEIRLVTGESRYYQYHWFTPETDDTASQEDVLDWEPISIRFQPFFFNDGDRDQEEIASKFGALRQSSYGYPIVQQQGNCSAFKTRFTNFAPRLGFYLGGNAASFETSNLSLDYDGATGLAAKRFRFTLPFLANALPSKRTFKLPASIYYYIRVQKAAMAFRTHEGSFIIDTISAIAERSLMIEAEISVLKREDNLWDVAVGETPGTGGHETPEFVPVYIGVTSGGKPALIDATGAVKSSPAWSALSTTTNSEHSCVAYVAADHLLFVGGRGGLMYIYNIADPANILMKIVKVFTDKEISCVRILNGKILYGSADSAHLNKIYVQSYYQTLDGYADGQSAATNTNSAIPGIITDFIFADSKFYACSLYGEVFTSLGNAAEWNEIFDETHDFYCMVETDSRLWVFGNNDHNYFAEKTDPLHWQEFGLTEQTWHYVKQALQTVGESILCISDDAYNSTIFHNAYITYNPSLRANVMNPPLAQSCAGIANVDGYPVIAIEEATGATKLATFHLLSNSWSYLVVPELYKKLFAY